MKILTPLNLVDGYEIAMGEGKTKKAAEEDAARKAYNAWPRPD